LLVFFSQDFLDANQAVSFFARIVDINPAFRRFTANVQSISRTNDKTQEKLVIEGIGPYPEDFVTISRYPMGATQEWIRENSQIISDGLIDRQEKKIEVDIKSGYFTSCSLL
jgi:hypothetical protein